MNILQAYCLTLRKTLNLFDTAFFNFFNILPISLPKLPICTRQIYHTEQRSSSTLKYTTPDETKQSVKVLQKQKIVFFNVKEAKMLPFCTGSISLNLRLGIL